MNYSPLQISTYVISSGFYSPTLAASGEKKVGKRKHNLLRPPVKINACEALYRHLVGHHLIPIGYPGEGILRLEADAVYGTCEKEAFTRKKLRTTTFCKLPTLVLRVRCPAPSPAPTPSGEPDDSVSYKEINVKMFGTGTLHITGATTLEIGLRSIQNLYSYLKSFDGGGGGGGAFLLQEGESCPRPPVAEDLSIDMINSTFYIHDYNIHQERMDRLLKETYGIVSIFEKSRFQGINVKYYCNTNNTGKDTRGLCICPQICKGKGSGDGPGQCRKVTAFVYSSGTISINGTPKMEHIREVYDFFVELLEKHRGEILMPKRVAAAAAAGAPAAR